MKGIITKDLRPFEQTLDALEMNPENPKVHSEKAIADMMVSLTRNGQDEFLVVDAHGMIIKGHRRFVAMRRLGWETAAVLVVTETAKKALKRALSDNALQRMSYLNPESMKTLLEALKAVDRKEPFAGWDEESVRGFGLSIMASDENDIGDDPKRAKKVFDSTDRRQVVLFYADEDYDRVMAIFEKAKAKFMVANFTEALLEVLK